MHTGTENLEKSILVIGRSWKFLQAQGSVTFNDKLHNSRDLRSERIPGKGSQDCCRNSHEPVAMVLMIAKALQARAFLASNSTMSILYFKKISTAGLLNKPPRDLELKMGRSLFKGL